MFSAIWNFPHRSPFTANIYTCKIGLRDKYNTASYRRTRTLDCGLATVSIHPFVHLVNSLIWHQISAPLPCLSLTYEIVDYKAIWTLDHFYPIICSSCSNSAYLVFDSSQWITKFGKNPIHLVNAIIHILNPKLWFQCDYWTLICPHSIWFIQSSHLRLAT